MSGLLLFLQACLVDTARYERALAELTDDDGDGVVERAGDCNDADASVYAGAPEACDEVDNDCDGATDESEDVEAWWYVDGDGDGFGQGEGIRQCARPSGFAASAGDCDDDDAARYPGAAEVCDGQDQDCDGEADDGVEVPTWYYDGDGDGFGDEDSAFVACEAPGGHIAEGGDCDDDDASVNPDADEEDCATTADDDCDGETNEQDARACRTFWYDGDGDGYGTDAAGCWCEATGPWSAARADDCDDASALANPDATEVCGNRADDDCDGLPGDCGVSGTRSLADADAIFTSEQEGGQVGASLSAAGDVDGDGFADVLVGKLGGREAALVRGPLSGLVPLSGADARYATDAAGEGTAVSGGADADGDGQPDLLLGAHGSLSGEGAAGVVYWLSGTPEGEVDVPDVAEWSGTADEPGDALGVAMDAGDIDGDGLADLVFGAPYSDASGADSGAVYVVSGPPAGAATLGVDGFTVRASSAGDELGWAVAAGGDVNGDGVGDLVVGASRADDGAGDAGAALIFFGPVAEDLDDATADARLLGDDANDFAGEALDFAGDVDGDGREDLVVGAFGENTPYADSGMAFLLYSVVTGDTYLSTSDARLSGEASGDFAARDVEAIGDLEADGFADLAVGSHYRSAGAGAVYVVSGPVYGLVSLEASTAILAGESAGDAAGIGLAAAGDTDGDGFVDLLAGACGSDRGSEDAGAIYLFLGGSW